MGSKGQRTQGTERTEGTTNGPVASISFKDDDACGSLTMSIDAIPGGHHLNIVAKWLYDRAQAITEEEGLRELGNPEGAMGEAKILISETEDKIKLSIEFGEEGNRDDFNPISHQLATYLVLEAMKEMQRSTHTVH